MQRLAAAREAGNSGAATPSALERALQYAERGWKVLPLHTPSVAGCSCGRSDCAQGKHPRISNGSKGATSDAAKIQSWWAQWPDANVGIATGPESGLFVLDVDGLKGQHSLASLPTILNTLRVNTGRRGDNDERTSFHLYMRWPPGGLFRNSTGRVGGNLDVRALGGYVLAPPSLHPSGLRYEWATETTLAEVPEWLQKRASQPSDEAIASGEIGLFFKGARNDGLIRLAGKWRRNGAERADILERLRVANAQYCRPPLIDSKLKSMAVTAAQWPIGGPDPLKVAGNAVIAESHANNFQAFTSIIHHLHRNQPHLPILLPVERLAELLKVTPKCISNYRKRALRNGWIEELQKSNHHAGKSTLFKVLSLP